MVVNSEPTIRGQKHHRSWSHPLKFKVQSSNDICAMKTAVIHPTAFVRKGICDNSITRSFIEEAICGGESDCFKCDSKHVQIISDKPLIAAKCDIMPELQFIDRHSVSQLCHELTHADKWDMCVPKDNFNRLHCPAVTLLMGKYRRSIISD